MERSRKTRTRRFSEPVEGRAAPYPPATDAPPIQYCRTEDGVNIAYWVIGAGPIVVLSHYYGLSNLDREWELPTLRAWYEELARDFTVVRYNARTTGQSDHGNIEPSNAGFFCGTSTRSSARPVAVRSR